MLIAAQLPDNVHRLCSAFADGLRALLGSKLHALVLYGATVFPETEGTGDVDLHAIIASRLTKAEQEGIQMLQTQMAEAFPPLGEELDAYVILLADACQSDFPAHQLDTSIVDDAWALHRAHWLAGRCVVLHGPEPAALVSAPTWEELDRALQGELAYVEKHLAEYPDYCILNLCRLMYSYRTRNVVTSKFASADWATAEYPEWQELIDRARRSYTGELMPGEREIMLSEVPGMFSFAQEKIDASHARSRVIRTRQGRLASRAPRL